MFHNISFGLIVPVELITPAPEALALSTFRHFAVATLVADLLLASIPFS